MSPQAFTPAERERLLQTKSYLLNHLHQHVPISRQARMTAMGEERYGEGFRLLFGLPPGAYLHRARMLTAHVLVRYTQRPLKEIAALCGYAHYKNFLTAYRKFYGARAGRART